jgi:hypothetical protein
MAKTILIVVLSSAVVMASSVLARAADCVHHLDRQTLITVGPGGPAPTPCPGETTILRAGEAAGDPLAPRSPSSVSPMLRSDRDISRDNAAAIAEPPLAAASRPGSSLLVGGALAHSSLFPMTGKMQRHGGTVRLFDFEPFEMNHSFGFFTTGNIGPFTTGSLAPFTTGSFSAIFVDPDEMHDAARRHEMMRRRP